ncbi:MAG: PEP-CTERM sorting domain-containing protein [Tepidisphaeraceae bacterium]
MASALPALILVSSASAHFDFTPRVEAGKVVTGGHDDEAGVDVDVLRVGGYDFGETPGDPYNIGDPGFNTMGASSFGAGTQLRLQALPVDGKYIRYWDGSGTPNFGPAPSGVTVGLAGSPSRFVTFADSSATYTPSSTTNLLVGSFASNGALHVHLTSSIFKDGLQVDGSVPSGAYLISFELANLTSSNGATGVSASEPLLVIYNNGLTEEQHDAAIDFAQASYVPEPATLCGLTMGGLLLGRRRRQV